MSRFSVLATTHRIFYITMKKRKRVYRKRTTMPTSNTSCSVNCTRRASLIGWRSRWLEDPWTNGTIELKIHWVYRRVNSSQIPELNEPSRAPTFLGSGRALRKWPEKERRKEEILHLNAFIVILDDYSVHFHKKSLNMFDFNGRFLKFIVFPVNSL